MPKPFRRARLVTLSTVAVLATGTPATAQTAIPCLRPQPPACVGVDQTFSTQIRIEVCHRQVERYVEEVRGYLACLNAEHHEAGRQLEATVDSFNCRLSGRTTCR